MTTIEINTITNYAEMILGHINESRCRHMKILCRALKFWNAAIYNFAEQSRRFENHLPIGRVGREGIEFVSECQ